MTAKSRLVRKPTVSLMIAAGFIVSLSGCAIPESVKEGLGIGKQAPDEFQVVERAPLTLPPDFDLRPPKPGVARPQQIDIRKQAEEVLMGRAAEKKNSVGYSPGEEGLLKMAGALGVDPGIRLIVDRESSIMAASDKGFVDDLMFWEGTLANDESLNPDVENRRLQTEDPGAVDEPTVIRRR